MIIRDVWAPMSPEGVWKGLDRSGRDKMDVGVMEKKGRKGRGEERKEKEGKGRKKGRKGNQGKKKEGRKEGKSVL